MFDLKPPIDPAELRELLEEAEIEVDAATFERIREAVQPMRAMLRQGGAGRRRSILRGAAIAAGWTPTTPGITTGLPQSAVPRAYVPADSPPTRRPTWRHLVSRLAAIYVAMVAGTFALMSMMGPERWVTYAFGGAGVALLLLAVTGWGLGNLKTDERGEAGAGGLVATILVIVSGAGPLLMIAVGSLFDPASWGGGDAIASAGHVIGLVTVYVVGSHVRALLKD